MLKKYLKFKFIWTFSVFTYYSVWKSFLVMKLPKIKTTYYKNKECKKSLFS